MTGKVKSYNASTRYGFITANGEDYRFHRNDWNIRLAPVKGLRVDFTSIAGEKGKRAENVRWNHVG